MHLEDPKLSRRTFLARGGAALAAGSCAPSVLPTISCAAEAPQRRPALVAVTLDLEMSRNFPTWEETRWDYEKGNLTDDVKQYSVEAGQRIVRRGGLLHYFAVGRVLEQPKVEWLEKIAAMGHPVGNHTYDHVNVKATRPEDVQFRFRRAPWLLRNRPAAEVISENIRVTEEALRRRVGIETAGFRTPGGFNNGLSDRVDVQHMLLGLGYNWVSSQYPAHKIGNPGEQPGEEVYRSIVNGQRDAQPFAYPSGLIEVPMSPISDVTAFRGGRWKLPWFLEATRRSLAWAIENRAAFDFLGHPSVLVVVDPKFQVIDLICDMVEEAGSRAEIVDLDAIARRATPRDKSS